MANRQAPSAPTKTVFGERRGTGRWEAAQRAPRAAAGGRRPAARPDPSTLLPAVGNVPYNMTEEMLAELFAEVGPVKASR
jgi:hypothetical protein